MKKKLVMAFDILVIIIIAILMLTGKNAQNVAYENTSRMSAYAANEELSFNLIATPEETRVKAGETVVVTLSLSDINMGKDGLNNVIGFLGYNEALFESVEIYAGGPEVLTNGATSTKWEIEINRIKNHSLYGKFCIFTMQEGVTENEDVATLVFKLKDNLKPQTTKVTFTELESSNGEVAVNEEDRVVTIIIYEDEPTPDEPTPDEPTPDDPAPVNPTPDNPKSPQTGDFRTMAVIAILIITILLNILVFAKKKNKKIIASILVLLIGIIGLKASYAVEDNKEDITGLQVVQETWLNSEDYLVTEESVSRIEPNTNVENILNKFNKSVEVKNGNEVVETGKVLTGMTVGVKNPTEKDADGTRKYLVSVFGDVNGDSSSNQVDLTTIIRNTVNSAKWNLSGVKFTSADITVDNKVNREDVLKSVHYIVYGEMEIPKFEQVQKPSIEVSSGERNEEENCYIGETKIVITENEENATRTQYKVSKNGEEITPYTEISRENKNENGKYETEITLTEEGIYKISAYTNGNLQNRSEIPYILVNIGKDNHGTLVIHHYNINSKDTEEKVKVADDEVFVVEYDKSFETTNLMNNSNVIKINGIAVETERSYLNSDGYNYEAVECDIKDTTATGDGVVTGIAYEGMEDVTYYYSVNTFQITGEVVDGNAWREGRTEPGKGTIKGVPETVEYGKDSKNKIEVTPDNGYKVSSIQVKKGERTQEQNLINGFKNVTQDIHIIAVVDEAIMVAKIVHVPAGLEELTNENGELILGSEYTSLEQAIKVALETNKLKTDDNKDDVVEIMLLADIYGEENIIETAPEGEGKNNVVIDLSGHTISNDNTDTPTLLVQQETSLAIIDKSEEQTGKVVNEGGIGIKVMNSGELTIGVDDDISVSDPSLVTPTIEGGIAGVNKEADGILNFYDGRIVSGGDSAILGVSIVNKKPTLYDPTLSTEDGKQVVTLKVVSGYEAAIGKTRYTTLEKAFEAANKISSNDPIEIDVISDEIVVLDTERNNIEKDLILDLNGRIVQANIENAIRLNGNVTLTITDSSSKVDESRVYYSLEKGNDNYFFELGNNFIEPNNIENVGTKAESYIEIDLTDKSEDEEFKLDFTYLLEGQSEIIAQVNTTKTYDETAENLIGLNGYNTATKTLNGGKKYYLYLSYDCKEDLGLSSCFRIYGITLNGKDVIKEVTIPKGKFESDNTVIGGQYSSKVILDNAIITHKVSDITFTEFPKLIVNNAIIEGNITATRDGRNIPNEIIVNGGLITGSISNKDRRDSSNVEVRGQSYVGGIINRGNVIVSEGVIKTLNKTGNLTINNSKIITSVNCYSFEKDGIINISNAKLNNIGIGYSGNVDGYVTPNTNIQNSVCGNIELVNGEATIKNSQSKQLIMSSSSSEQIGTINIQDCNIGSISDVMEDGKQTVNLLSGSVGYINTNYANSRKGGEITLNIIDGKIESSAQAITIDERTTINLGTKNTDENNELSINTPIIKGATGGIRGNGKLCFYDGVIISPKDAGLVNVYVKDLEVNPQTAVEKVEFEENGITYEKIYLSTNVPAVARISSSGNKLDLGKVNSDEYELNSEDNYYYFKNLNSAIKVCSENAGNIVSKIEILSDISILEDRNIENGQNIELDLCGNSIICSTITNNGKVVISNSSAETNGKIEAEVVNNGTLELGTNVYITGDITNSGTLTMKSSTCGDIINNGTLTLEDGANVTGDKYDSFGGLINSVVNNKEMFINGGTIIAGSLNNNEEASLEVNGGSINATLINKSALTSKAGVYITNGNIEKIESDGDIEIQKSNSGEVRIKEIVINEGDYNLLINGGNYEIIRYIACSEVSLSNAIINDVTIGGTQQINLLNIANCTIKNISINSNISEFTSTGKTEIKYFVVNVNGECVIPTSGELVIEHISNAGILSFGENDGVIKEESIKIDARSVTNGGFPINNYGTMKFYDGIIIWPNLTSSADIGIITDIATGYELQTITYEDEYDDSGNLINRARQEMKLVQMETAVMVNSSVIDSVQGIECVEQGDNYYFYSIEDAINACKDNTECTLYIQRDISDRQMEISENKNIVIDLQGHIVKYMVQEAIVNNGTLKIIDSSEEKTGTIETKLEGTQIASIRNLLDSKTDVIYDNNFIQNNGTLNLETVIVNGTIYNNNVMNVNGAILNGIKALTSKNNIVDSIENRGTLNIGGGATIAYISNGENGNATLNSATYYRINNTQGTINCVTANNEDINITYLENSNECSIEGGTISIANNAGTLNVKKGIIDRLSCTNDSSTNIGDKNDSINKQDVTVNECKGVINFYSGTIGMKINSSNAFSQGWQLLVNIPQDAEICNVQSEEGDYILNKLTLTQAQNSFAVGASEYKTLKDAVEACKDYENPKITLLRDIYYTALDSVAIDNENIVLDLNGNEIKYVSSEPMIINNGTLKVIDSSIEKQGKIVRLVYNGVAVITNNNQLTLENIDIRDVDKWGTGMLISNNGKVIVSGGNYYGKNIVYSNASSENIIKDSAKLNGSIEIMNENEGNNGILSISGSSEVSSISAKNCNIELNNAIVTAETKLNQGVKGNINNSEIDLLTITDDAEIVVNSSNLANIDNSGDLTINNSNIESAKVTSTTHLLTAQVYNRGTLNLNNTNIKYTNTNSFYYALDISGGKMTTIIGGSVISENGSAIFIRSGYNGVSDNYSLKGKLTLGKDDHSVDNNLPVIKGKVNGIVQECIIKNRMQYGSSAELYFYDGTIEAETGKALSQESDAFQANITSTPRFYTIQYSNDEKKATLTREADYSNVLSVGSLVFDADHFAEAIAQAQESGLTIEVNSSFVQYEPVEIPEGANITIDLKGQTIEGASIDALIHNKGTLTIIDSVGTGLIRNYAGKVFGNEGTLNIGTNDDNVSNTNPQIISNTIAIQNTGIINFYDGIIKGVEDIIVGGTTNIPNSYSIKEGTYVENEGQENEITFKTKYLGQ